MAQVRVLLPLENPYGHMHTGVTLGNGLGLLAMTAETFHSLIRHLKMCKVDSVRKSALFGFHSIGLACVRGKGVAIVKIASFCDMKLKPSEALLCFLIILVCLS